MTVNGRPTHIAILDDDSFIRIALVRLLQAEGMTVDSHATSDELFDALALQSPDCLILDLQMPKMSGVDILKHLGQLGFRIPTIIITGSEEAVSRNACLRAGAAEYLRKPLDADRLIQTIEQIGEKLPNTLRGLA